MNLFFSYYYYREDNVLSRNHILMGTLDGKVGLLILETNKTVRVTWLLNSSNSEITALDTYILQDTLDFIVGRQNGTVEVFAFPTDEEATPTLRFRYVGIFSKKEKFVLKKKFTYLQDFNFLELIFNIKITLFSIY